MKKVNLDVPVLDLKGAPAIDADGRVVKIKEVVANMIIQSKGGDDAARLLSIALKINESAGEIDLEDNDHASILKCLKGSVLSVLVKARILEALG